MSNQQRNKDLPSNPIMFKTQFGQDVILAGFTKQEKVALYILKGQLSLQKIEDLSDEDLKFLIDQSYKISEKFCEYLEKEAETEFKLV